MAQAELGSSRTFINSRERIYVAPLRISASTKVDAASSVLMYFEKFTILAAFSGRSRTANYQKLMWCPGHSVPRKRNRHLQSFQVSVLLMDGSCHLRLPRPDARTEPRTREVCVCRYSEELAWHPDGFLALMGVSSFGYLGGKLARKPGPIIDDITATLGSFDLKNQWPKTIDARQLQYRRHRYQ
jgi:hypothetical protein